MKRVLFVCVHNAGRSQMAEALFNHLADGRAVAESAGSLLADRVNPIATEVMREIGIDISGATPKVITQEMVDRADLAFTMGCAIDEACPAQFIPADDWGLEDPSGQPIEKVRQIRDQIETKVRELLGRLDAPDPSGRRT